MSYATRTGVAPAAATVVTRRSTAARTSPLQLPNQSAWEAAAILSISAASAGRVLRQASAVCFALEEGSTYHARPASALVDVAAGVGVGLGAGLGVLP